MMFFCVYKEIVVDVHCEPESRTQCSIRIESREVDLLIGSFYSV